MSFKVGGGPLLLNFSFFPFVRLFSVPPPSRGQVWFTRYWESKSVPTEMVRMGCCLYLLGLGKRKMRKDRFSCKCTGQSRDLAVCRRKEGERDVGALGLCQRTKRCPGCFWWCVPKQWSSSSWFPWPSQEPMSFVTSSSVRPQAPGMLPQVVIGPIYMPNVPIGHPHLQASNIGVLPGPLSLT